MASAPDDLFAVTVQPRNNGRAVLILTADDVQDLEFFYPYYRFSEEGFRVDVVTPKGGAFKGKEGMGLKESKAIRDVDPAMYELLYIPGGKAPAALKKNEDALQLATAFVRSSKPVAAFCHGPQVLADAGLITGKRIAAWPEIKGEITEAGATYIDQPVVVDGQFITGRWPGDLPAHLAQTLQVLNQAPAIPLQVAARR